MSSPVPWTVNSTYRLPEETAPVAATQPGASGAKGGGGTLEGGASTRWYWLHGPSQAYGRTETVFPVRWRTGGQAAA